MRRFAWLILTVGAILIIATTAHAQPTINRTPLVVAIKQQVIAAGIDLNHGPGECGRFEVTKRVAWALRAEGAGLLAKFGGQNGCSATNTTTEPKYGVDVIMYTSGAFVDILCGGGDGNTPCWNPGVTSPALWRAPFDPGDTQPPPPTPPPTPTPIPTVDLMPILNELAVQRQLILDIQSRGADTQERLMRLAGDVEIARQELAIARGDIVFIKEDTHAIREGFYNALRWVGKFGGPIVAGLLAGRELAK